MDEPRIWIDLAATSAMFSMLAYALFGGADFGGGVWDLFASGPRQQPQRLAIQRAMGPVWEANHVWLIFVLVILFTCFPRGYIILGIALFVPFHLILLGIMLRGASFVFRAAQRQSDDATAQTSAWGVIFGVASLITPFLLGTAFGVVTEGDILISEAGAVELSRPWPWTSIYSLANGFLALSTCAYLAAVYLTNETVGELREDFRRRAIFAGTTTAILAGCVFCLAWRDARWFFDNLLTWHTMPVLVAGLFCFAGSAVAVFTRRFRWSRIFAAGEITFILFGWGLAQYPYLIHPSLTFADAAAPLPTLQFFVWSMPVGGLLLAPSLWLLFRVFKSG